MKNKKVVALVAVAALLANLALAAIASAGTTGSEQTEQDINSGNIAIHSVPNASALKLPNITAADVLGTAFTNTVNNPTGAGWSVMWSDTRYSNEPVSVSVNLNGNFSSGGNNFNKANMWLQDDATVTKQTGYTDCVGYNLKATWESIGASGFSLYSEGNDLRYEKCYAHPDFRIVIPSNQPVGNYTTTMTFTIA